MDERAILSTLADYVSDKITAEELTPDTYISTDNMISKRGGIRASVYTPTTGKVTAFKKGDILISNIRPYFKKIWYATFDGGCCADVLVVRGNGTVSNEYLYYVLSQDDFFDYVMSAPKGSKMPRGDKDHIMRYPIPLLNADLREKISIRFGAVDQKIETNKKIISDIEEMIKTVYEYWFIQFNFPNLEGKPYKDNEGKLYWNETIKREIPIGWDVVNLASITDMETTVINPTNEESYWHYSIPAFDENGIPAFERGSQIDSGKYKVPEECILVSKLNPQFKRLWVVKGATDKSICSTEFMPFVSKNKNYEFLYALLNGEDFYTYMVQCSSSSTGSRKRMEPELCKIFKVVYPADAKVIEEFCALFNAPLNTVVALKEENSTLIKFRDYTVPLLLNGQATF